MTDEKTGVVRFTVELTALEANMLPEYEHELMAAAVDTIRVSPIRAGLLGRASVLIGQIHTDLVVSRAQSDEPKGKGRPAQTSLPRVKHTYGANGICAVKHDGRHVCGATRTRAPRAGSSAAAAAAAAARTAPLPGIADPPALGHPAEETSDDESAEG